MDRYLKAVVPVLLGLVHVARPSAFIRSEPSTGTVLSTYTCISSTAVQLYTFTRTSS